MKEQGPASAFKCWLSSAHTAPIKHCLDEAFLHIRNPALFNEDQLNPASFYLGSHNRCGNKFSFFFPGNYWQKQPCCQGRKPSPITHLNPGWIPVEPGAPSCPQSHQNPAGISPGFQSSPTATHHGTGRVGPLLGEHVELFQPSSGLHSQASPEHPAMLKTAPCLPGDNHCNGDIQLNNSGPLLLPQTNGFFSSHKYFLSQVLFQKEKKTPNKMTKKQNPKLKNNRKKKEGGERKERNCSPFFSLCAG